MKQFSAEIPLCSTSANLRVVESELDRTAPETFLTDTMAGLARTPKSIPPKYFYDRRGSELFDAICRLPEYYPTRTEMALLRTHAKEIATLSGPGAQMIEFGSGAGIKAEILLRALRAPAAYVGIDISRDYLVQATQRLAFDHPGMSVVAVCADFTTPFRMPALPGHGPRLGFFPGSTVGNLTPDEAEAFLCQATRVLRPGGAMIVGVDLKKDVDVLNAAYNDAQGITAAFNLNLLTRMNAELGTAFDSRRFAHAAFYNAAAGRIEMHLRSLTDQHVRVSGRDFTFAVGESLHTENSYKYEVGEFQALAQRAGFRPQRAWVDPAGLFSVHYLGVPR